MLGSLMRLTGFSKPLSTYSMWDYFRDNDFSDADLIKKFFPEGEPAFDLNADEDGCSVINSAISMDRYEFLIYMLDAGARLPIYIIQPQCLALTRLLLWYAPYIRETARFYREPDNETVYGYTIYGAIRVPAGTIPLAWDCYAGKYEKITDVIEEGLQASEEYAPGARALIEETAQDSLRVHLLKEDVTRALTERDYDRAQISLRAIADIFHKHLRTKEPEPTVEIKSAYTDNYFSNFRPVFVNFYQQKWIKTLRECYALYEEGKVDDVEGLTSLLILLAQASRELGLHEDVKKYNQHLQRLNARVLAHIEETATLPAGTDDEKTGGAFGDSGLFGIHRRRHGSPKSDGKDGLSGDEKKSLLRPAAYRMGAHTS